MRRFLTLALSASLVLGLSAFARLSAQDEKKDGQAPAAASAPTQDAKKVDETKPAEKPAEVKAVEAAPTIAVPEPKPIPPEVQAKLDAARRAVAEAIVAAQDAGLVDTTIDPPPILDILITGRADDKTKLKAITKDAPEVGVSPEVFGAWFTNYGQAEGVVAEKNVRIIPPSKGLKAWYDERNRIFTGLIAEVRKAKGPAPAPAPTTDAPKPEETKPAPAPVTEPAKAEETKPAPEPPKAEETKPAPEPPKAEETKPAEAPKA